LQKPINNMAAELQTAILDFHVEQTWPTRPAAERLEWVCVFGRNRRGWEAVKRLFKAVVLHDVGQLISFLDAGRPDRFLPQHFSRFSATPSNPLRGLTCSLYIAFETGLLLPFNTVPLPFNAIPFHILTGLQNLTFDISEYDYNQSFRAMTEGGTIYPTTLRTVRMVCSASRVSPPF
jgi:hypothetical protein